VSAILLDTNGLCAQEQFRVDVFDQLARMGYTEFLVTRCVVGELERLRAAGSARERAAAEVGASLLSRCRVVEDATGAADCDDSIARKAKELNAAVLSLDRLLRRRLRAQGTSVVYLRGEKRLEQGA